MPERAGRPVHELIRDYLDLDAALRGPRPGLAGDATRWLGQYRRFVTSRGHLIEAHRGALFALAAAEPKDSAVRAEALGRAGRGLGPVGPWLCLRNPPATDPNPALVRTLAGHKGPVRSVAVAASGKGEGIVVPGGEDRAVRVWDAPTGECRRVLEDHDGGVSSVALDAAGRIAASGGDDGTVRLWDTDTGQCRRALEGHDGQVNSVALGADGRTAASGGDDGTVRLWDTDTGQCRRALKTPPGWLASVALDAAGRTAASGGDDGTVRLWDTDTGKCRRALEVHHDGPVRSVALDAAGRTAVSAGHDGRVRVWDTVTGKCRRILTGHDRGVASVALDAAGRTAASGGDDGTVRLWDTDTGRCLALFACDGAVGGVDLSRSARWFVAAGLWDGRVLFFEIK